jgi:hypothetical protein
MKTELIAKLEELMQKDPAESAADVRAVQKDYQRLWHAELEKAKQEYIESGGSATEFDYSKQPEDVQFENLIEKFNALKKESDQQIAAEQSRNLLVRQEIIAKIRDLSSVSENVGTAMRKLQELQAQWKETGPVSPHKYKEVQADYSKAIEDIYYNLKIFRDLQEHDLKKNLEMKTVLIEKLKGLLSNENVKDSERLIKIYRNEWDEIGPVPHTKWEALKAEYKTVLNDVYAKLKSHYHSIEEQKEQNLQVKLGIIEKARELLNNMEEARATKWNEGSDKIIALQAEWKSAGRTSEKHNEKIWAEFRALCDEFFEKKKAFFGSLNEKYAANRKIKHDLIAAAEALQNSTDWQKTGHELIKLQEEWKKHPGYGDKEEPKLFAKFRKACNTFFDAKKEHYEVIDAGYKDNLVVKEEILARLNSAELSEDLNANRELLRQFKEEWNAAGLVPLKDKKRVNDAFYNRLDELYDKLNIDRQEKAIMQFRSKLDRLAGSENNIELLRKESDYLRKSIEEIKGRVLTYENNLGFFKNSKGTNPLLKEVEEKITAEKEKSEALIAKRKLVESEISKIQNSNKPKAEA